MHIWLNCEQYLNSEWQYMLLENRKSKKKSTEPKILYYCSN